MGKGDAVIVGQFEVVESLVQMSQSIDLTPKDYGDEVCSLIFRILPHLYQR
jgi:hypothetical protein